MRLQPGKFYEDKSGYIWCCYSIRKDAPPEDRARCISLDDDESACFYLDGRYDNEGRQQKTLIRELKIEEVLEPDGSTQGRTQS